MRVRPLMGSPWLPVVMHHQLVVAILIQIVDINQRAIGNAQLAQLHGHGGHVDHAASHKAHLAVIVHRAVHHLLQAEDITGEHGDNHAARGPLLICS